MRVDIKELLLSDLSVFGHLGVKLEPHTLIFTCIVGKNSCVVSKEEPTPTWVDPDANLPDHLKANLFSVHALQNYKLNCMHSLYYHSVILLQSVFILF